MHIYTYAYIMYVKIKILKNSKKEMKNIFFSLIYFARNIFYMLSVTENSVSFYHLITWRNHFQFLTAYVETIQNVLCSYFQV